VRQNTRRDSDWPVLRQNAATCGVKPVVHEFASRRMAGTMAVMANEQRRTGADVPANVRLTARERRFVEEFLLTANGAKAAEAAGYSRRSAKVRAARLMRRPRVIAALSRAQDTRAERVGIESDRVLAELKELAFSNIGHYEIDPIAGTVRLRPDAPPRAMRAIAFIRHRAIPAGPNGKIYEIEIRLWDKPSMLRLAGRHVGVKGFVHRLELTGENGSAIELQHRVDEMSDDELKARVAELMASNMSWREISANSR